MACADTATDKAKPAIVINLIILHLPKPSNQTAGEWSGSRVQAAPCKLTGFEIDQGLYDDWAGTSVVQRELLPMVRSGSIRRRSAARRAPPASAQNGANCCVTG